MSAVEIVDVLHRLPPAFLHGLLTSPGDMRSDDDVGSIGNRQQRVGRVRWLLRKDVETYSRNEALVQRFLADKGIKAARY